ncbi:tyrosine-type recombinase/integrase [Brevibacillus choshinensis]|uniref:tyrosine-type recombinase/integrase n=1 Tax=Brevibacillus choshinensis TaxID=54911 RepID=UPI002E226A3E|nr:tyrosine-type recombinase/integrase [Brevibacillus choshinensis]MED4785243.1 tyrosine-type recombinase/integrase [Brevibacillus choshinensis]
MHLIDLFLNWLSEEGKDSKTITAYKTSVSQFLTWYFETFGNEELSQVKPIDIKEFISYLKHIKNRKQTTINKSIASLKTFFSYLVEYNYVHDNPMIRIKIQKVQSTDKLKETMKWLSKEEQDRFTSYVDLEKNANKRLRNLAIIDLMLFAGLRVSEVVNLKIDDVRINGNIDVTIREGKQGKYATVTLVNKYSKNLRQWLKYRQTLNAEIHAESPYLFVSERTGQLGARGIQVMLDKYSKLARMENITPHRLRHSYCKNLANSGASIEVIRRLARHESIQTTAIYIDPSHQEQLKALESM